MSETMWPPAWPWWAAGVVIGLMVPLMYWLHNQALGVSTGYGSLINLVRPGLRTAWFRATFGSRVDWRVWFVAGMVLGAFVAARLSGRPWVTAEMGLFTAMVDWPLPAQGLFFFAGGVLLAVGARIAGGCTSGHSIHGIANLQPASIVATAMFMGFGVLATWLVRVLVLGGGA